MFGKKKEKVLHKLELKLKKAGHQVGTGICVGRYCSFQCTDCGYIFNFRENSRYPNMMVLGQPAYFYMHTPGYSYITELLTCKEVQNNDKKTIPVRTVTRNQTNIKLKKLYKKLSRFGHVMNGNICTACKASFGIDPVQTRMHHSNYLVNRIMRCEEVKTVEMIRDIIE